jgi:hypothetical protein
MSQALFRLAAVPSLGAALLCATGCAENDSSLFIRQVSVSARGSTCIVTPDPSALFLTRGYMDAAFVSRYQASLLVGSQLTARGDRQQLRTETSRLKLEGSEVYATDDLTGSLVFPATTIPGSGFIDPASGTDPSYGLLGTILLAIPAALATKQQAGGRGSFTNVTSHVRAFGHTLGGTYIESGEFLFPISVCYGCLVTFPTDAIVTNTATVPPTLSCSGTSATSTSVTAPCYPGQDDVVDCRICQEYLGPDAPVCQP